MLYADDPEYASRRLDGTFVRLTNGSPVYIVRTNLDSNNRVQHLVEYLETGTADYVKHTDLDLLPIPLGFVNHERQMIYICRKPMRRDWKQGLSQTSMAGYGNYRPADLPHRTLVQPIKNTYPSFSATLDGIRGVSSQAFSREFGLLNDKNTREVRLIYRKYPVGTVKNRRLTLCPEKTFLVEALQESLAHHGEFL